ncbi:MAG TPA: efflux RND transporter periplasmic adaptor subunit [Polyangiales bacterium]|nr:efflux RND transporter periplasmic adaptor subunit [Polyangiales bacterium]
MTARGAFFQVMCVCALALAAVGCKAVETARAADGPHAEVIPVRLGQVAHGPLQRRVRASGTLQLKSEADLSFKVGGVVTRVAVDAGARVRKGQLLASVDPIEAQAAHSQALQAVLKAERDLARLERLHESGAVGPVDVQNLQTSLTLARAAADAAQFNLRQTNLIAPDDGVIDRRLVEVGEIATPGRPVFHLRGVSRGVIVRAALIDRDALELRRGDAARVTLDARPDMAFAAHVSHIASTASAATGTIEVELRLQADDALELPSGLTVKVELQRSERAQVSVPLSALVDGEGSSAAVYVVEGDRAKRVPVQVSFLAEDRAALASGLEQVEQVVESGASRLEDGSRVRVTR